jgi:hypothetical protein
MKIFKSDEPSHWYRIHDESIEGIDSLFVKRGGQKVGLYRQMFNEDFSRIFCSQNHRNNTLFKLSTNDEILVEKLLGNVRTGYGSREINETIFTLVEDITQSLIGFGRANYFLYDDIVKKEIVIVPISSNGIVDFCRTPFQWVPSYTPRHREENDKKFPREIRILDAVKLMRFDMPRSIKRMLSAQNNTLATLDKHRNDATNFHLAATHENPNPTNYFDFNVWKDNHDVTFHKATQGTGWNGRHMSSSPRSDFFNCHRLIRFRRNQFLLRDSILKQLSSELTRVGKDYNVRFSVDISGTDELLSVEHLNELEAKLSREEVGFNEVTDYCYKR